MDVTTVARDAADAGAAVAADLFRSDIEVETKDGKTDVVTRADREAQRAAIGVIRESYPDDDVVGEEEDALKEVPETGRVWIIDPIDGTNNYVRGVQCWATSVAVVEDGNPLAAANVLPSLDDTVVAGAESIRRNGDPIAVSDVTDPELATVSPTLWWGHDRREEYATAVREIVTRFDDLRRHGSAQATLSMVAAGALEGAVSNVDPNPWDTVAGVHMVRQAGGRVTDLHGDPWRHDSVGLVASNGGIHDELLATVRAIEDARTGE